jgi:hypothetical protein
MLLWLQFWSLWPSQCFCGYSSARFGQANVAVAAVLLVLAKPMLLWLQSCSFRPSQCCCGVGPARFAPANVVVATVLLDFGTANVGVAAVLFILATVLFVLAQPMLLWPKSCSFWPSQCCCGYSPARFGKANVAVAAVLPKQYV